MVRKSDLLTRDEACERLNVAVRTIQVYAQEGLIDPIYLPVRGRKTAPFYRKSEIADLRRQLQVGA